MASQSLKFGLAGATVAILAVGGYLLIPRTADSMPTETAQTQDAATTTGAPDTVAAALARSAAAKDMASVYAAHDYAPLWQDADGVLSSDAKAVTALLQQAGDQGLPAARYQVPAQPANGDAQARADYDIALSRAALAYAHDVRFGLLNPQRVFNDVNLPAAHEDVAAGLVEAAHGGQAAAYLRGLEPQVAEYGLLKSGLHRYRDLAARPWPAVQPGDANSLAMRLAAEGYLPAAQQGQQQQAQQQAPQDVAGALKRFQAANGLEPSGKLDQKTVAALNISAVQRADQIAVNLERWRWLPRDLGNQHIMVNVPAASLVVVENGDAALTSRVVVGAPDKPTPILGTKAVAVTINPAWHIPKSIVEKEIKPKLAKNPGYLEAKDMVEKDGDYVQQPGPSNALGVAKFEMPNPFDVYMHDTPSKKAFFSDERALSHGCVRVEAIRPLVERVLGMSEDELAQAVETGTTTRKPLKAPIPVFIQYWTAVPSANGIGFYDDVYGRDAKMIEALKVPGTARLASTL